MDVWGIIEAAIAVASSEYSVELKRRRDGIVKRLYAMQQCRNCDANVIPQQHPNSGVRFATKEVSRGGGGGDSPYTPQSIPQVDEEDDGEDHNDWLYDEEQTKIYRIKEQLEDPHQTEDSIIELLQTLADMDLTFKGLKETDIGRHVNQLRKHSSNEVRSLVKHLVRKWKDLVDDWVGSNHNDHRHSSPTGGDTCFMICLQASDLGYSSNPHNWSLAHERVNPEQEQKSKGVVPKRETPPSRPLPQSHPVMAAAAAHRNQPRKEENIDLDKLASARKRLHENYQEAQNAKKQRTIQVMDIHEIPKPKNGFISKNKGNFQGRHHRR
ncbi:hypothetical protein E3N88_29519 [Mikania micrantha]|uniref:TFIIS N-terminal domain-containing protein n=1 Tax=Mikania micrantha TaxID=192012 RepID=A0A5N6MJQ0_9ASTR|nr:hypothetical protein E3N88_29519 [Mikania micrantha]